MTLDSRDIMILRLAAMYHRLPYRGVGRFGFGKGLEDELGILSAAGMLKVSRDKEYMRPSPQAFDMLSGQGYDYARCADRPYNSRASLRRRLEAASIALTALRAGIDPLPDGVGALSRQPVFLPAFALRAGGGNMMNAASCAGFGHWGGTGFMLHYVGPGGAGMYEANELGHLHNLSSLFDPGLGAPLALVFAGQCHASLHRQLSAQAPSKKHGRYGFRDFWDVYRRSDLPIHLLPCDETGAMQLAIMRQPGYRLRIAKAALGPGWAPNVDGIPDADGSIGGRPLVIAADMDARRVGRICRAARQLGHEEVMVAALKSQVESFYMPFMKGRGIRLLGITRRILDDAFGESLPPCPLGGE